MRVIVVGLGIQGRKRRTAAGSECVATVDPGVGEAEFPRIEDVPLARYDGALVCTPDAVKPELLTYLLSHGKHCLVEKPLLLGERSAFARLAALCGRTVCYTAYNHRFEPHLVRVKQVIEEGVLGPLYTFRMLYGNGTAREVFNSPWRDQGAGVLPDLGSHLLDTVLFLFGDRGWRFVPAGFHAWENRSFDHVRIEGTGAAPLLQLEATLLSWRNTFQLDLIGERGSVHVNCLCKWGPSSFTLRTRVLPSGRPPEQHEVLECADPTWEAEYRYFKDLCQKGGTNLENDAWIDETLTSLERQWNARMAR